jgi:hypothetical protein
MSGTLAHRHDGFPTHCNMLLAQGLKGHPRICILDQTLFNARTNLLTLAGALNKTRCVVPHPREFLEHLI